MIEVEVLKETGFNEALYGIGYSYGITSSGMPDIGTSDYNRLVDIACRLSCKRDGSVAEAEAKFLRMMAVWARIKAPTYWWIQYDTYKVGTVAQSESKMHTLMRTKLTKDKFTPNVSEITINELEDARQKGLWEYLLENLPVGFIQQRIVSLNYAVLRTIFKQRKGHKLKEWTSFIEQFNAQLKYPSLLEQSHV